MRERRTPGFCALCKSRCGSIMVTRDGEFLRQEPNPEHPTGAARAANCREVGSVKGPAPQVTRMEAR
jgi:hypothetical protein